MVKRLAINAKPITFYVIKARVHLALCVNHVCDALRRPI